MYKVYRVESQVLYIHTIAIIVLGCTFCFYIAVDCGPLRQPKNGIVNTIPDTYLNSTATYSCNPGYNLTGNTQRVCQSNGSWSSSAPYCAGENGYYASVRMRAAEHTVLCSFVCLFVCLFVCSSHTRSAGGIQADASKCIIPSFLGLGFADLQNRTLFSSYDKLYLLTWTAPEGADDSFERKFADACLSLNFWFLFVH